MKNILMLFTNSFPYGKGENFIDYEIEYSKDNYDYVYIIPSEVKNETRYKLNDEKYILVNEILKAKRIHQIFYIIESFFSKEFIIEIIYILKSKRNIVAKIKDALKIVAYGMQSAKLALKQIKKMNLSKDDNVVLYSYWLSITAFACLKLKKSIEKKCNTIVVSRTHGHDLYEYRKKYEYLPFREFFYTNIDKIYPISKNGQEYIYGKYSYNIINKIELKYLGTPDYTSYNIRNMYLLEETNKNRFHLVSCSSIIPIKRLEFIIDVLKNINSFEITWYHLGDGESKEGILEYAEKKLGINVKTIFLGQLDHKQLVNFYKENRVDLFINTSIAEGLPVSIMEAASFGIPIIAPDIGGISEIVSSKNGFLMTKNAEPKEYSNKIVDFFHLDFKQKLYLANESRKIWEEKFSAQNCYTNFYESIRGIHKNV